MEIIFFDQFEDFLNDLEKFTVAKVLRTLDLLEQFGAHLGMPHSKKIERNLFELRIRGKQEVRIIYTFRSNQGIVLHAFVKKSQKISLKDLNLARASLKCLEGK